MHQPGGGPPVRHPAVAEQGSGRGAGRVQGTRAGAHEEGRGRESQDERDRRTKRIYADRRVHGGGGQGPAGSGQRQRDHLPGRRVDPIHAARDRADGIVS